jgi:hypothetical protein
VDTSRLRFEGMPEYGGDVRSAQLGARSGARLVRWIALRHAGSTRPIASGPTRAPAQEQESPRASGSVSGWAQALLSFCYVMVPVVALGTLYLLPYLRGEATSPLGFDTPHYLWRANLVHAFGLDTLSSIPVPFLNPNADRPGFPVLASLIQTAKGPTPGMLLFLVPAIAAIAIGGAAGAFAVEVLDEPQWSFPLYAVLVGGSLAVVQTASGSLDNLTADSVVLAAATVALIAASGRRGVIAGGILIASALLIHWIIAGLLMMLLALLASFLLPASIDRREAGARLRDTPSGRLVAVLGSGSVIALFGLWISRAELHTPQIGKARISNKVAARIPSLRLWLTVPLAVAGSACLWWLRRSTLRRWGCLFLGCWVAVLAVGATAYWILDGRDVPLYRVAEFVLAVPILCAAAVVAAPRLAGDRRWLGVAIGVAIAVASVAVSLRLADAAWNDESSIMDPVISAEVAASVTYLHIVPADSPVIFVVSGNGFTASDRVIRAELPGELIARVRTFQGASGDLLAGRPPSFGQAEDIQRSWEGVKDLLHEDYVAIWLSSLNRLADAPAGARAIAPGVMVIRGPDPTAAQALSVSDGPSQGELIRAGVTTLTILLIVGLGWSTALVDAGWLARLGLAPAFGVAVLVLGGVIGARVGWSLVGAAGGVLFAALAMSGWLIVGVEAVVGRYRAKESGGVGHR